LVLDLISVFDIILVLTPILAFMTQHDQVVMQKSAQING